MADSIPASGAGLGLRRAFLGTFAKERPAGVDFLEVAPENWIGIGGMQARQFRACTEAYPLALHGLSLNLGGQAPLDTDLVKRVGELFRAHDCIGYSEHLSCCADQRGHLYDLMPIPFTMEAVSHVASRIRQVQDLLGRRIAVENSSYYAAPGKEMAEIDFINEVLRQADCDLLLDVNNVYVNSINHRYDPRSFLAALPGERITYIHVAGHHWEAEDLRVDTHGAKVIDPVWELLEAAYRRFGVLPTLVERDFNFPPLNELLEEVASIRQVQSRASDKIKAA